METNNEYKFELNEKVTRSKVSYKNRYGIELVGDLYQPKNADGKLPAIAISGPFGAVKEQSSGLYANELAGRGFITLAFDNSFVGESGGQPRHMASPDIFTEDYSATVDYFTTLDQVDNDKIVALGICGLSGMAITAATVDPRIKAVVTTSMYDMTQSIGAGFRSSYSLDDKRSILQYIAEERTKAAETGEYHPGPHEVDFDENRDINRGYGFPDELPEDADPVTTDFFNYYCTDRGYAERSINSNTGWNSTVPYSFFAFPLHHHLENLNDHSVLLIHGSEAHSLYHSQAVVGQNPRGCKLMEIPGASHVDLYDQMDKIPFDRITDFYNSKFN